jgi:cation/acetate symporter
MVIIGGFYLLPLIIGHGAAVHVGASAITGLDKGGNMAGPLLAQLVGGGADSALGNFFLAGIAAVTFVTIAAVVVGLVPASAAAISHDIWVGIVKGERATQAEEARSAGGVRNHCWCRCDYHRHSLQGAECLRTWWRLHSPWRPQAIFPAYG